MADEPVPEVLYRGDAHPISVVTAGEENLDDRMALAIKHSGGQPGSGGEIQSFTDSVATACRFARTRPGAIVRSINTTDNPEEGRIFMSTAHILEYHAERLVTQRKILPGTAGNAVSYIFSNNENEYFWLITKNPAV